MIGPDTDLDNIHSETLQGRSVHLVFIILQKESMTLNQFVVQNQLRETDAIVLRKKFFGMVDHYALYMGVHDNHHTFIANYTKGVRVIPYSELLQFLSDMKPTRIERFLGSEPQREAAYNRAVSRIGEKAYNYVTNNCEHFKNWVHNRVNKSDQVDNAIKGAAVVGGGVLALGLLSLLLKND